MIENNDSLNVNILDSSILWQATNEYAGGNSWNIIVSDSISTDTTQINSFIGLEPEKNIHAVLTNLSIAIKNVNIQALYVAIPSLIVLFLWYPCYENLFSIVRKFKFNRSPMDPDKNHVHLLSHLNHLLIYYFLL